MINEVIKRVQYMLPNTEVSVQTVVKNNDILRTGVVIRTKGSDIAPVFYVDSMMERGMSADQIAIYICRAYRKEDEKTFDNAKEFFLHYHNVKNLLNLQLINRASNQERLKDIPYVPFMDLSAIVVIQLEKSMRQQAIVKVTKQLIEVWGVSFDEIYEDARRNFMKKKPQTKKLTDVIRTLAPSFYLEDFDVPMYIITNETMVYGASAILNNLFMQELVSKIGDDIIVIPSSIHECIVIPAKGISEDSVNEIIQEVNCTNVEPEERLSDHMYLYKRNYGWYN